MSEVSFCVNCGKQVPKGEAFCKECWDEDHKQACEFGGKYNTTP